MPHATMDTRRQTGIAGESPDIYYSLEPIGSGNMNQDHYGSLPGQMSHGYNSFPVSQNISQPQQQQNYGTLPSQHMRLPSYNSTHNDGRNVPLSGYHTLPTPGGQYGTLPSHIEGYSSQTMPVQNKNQFSKRQLPLPSLTRHSMKILQVPMMVLGEGGNIETISMRGSPSPSPSPSSTISDSGVTPSPSPQSRSGVIHMVAMDEPLKPGHGQSFIESPTASYGHGTFPTSDNNQYQMLQLADKNVPAFPYQSNNNVHRSPGFPQAAMTQQGLPQQGFPHYGSNGMVHAATLPHRSSVIPNHVQHRPSPSSSPVSTTSMPATLPFAHNQQQQHRLQPHQQSQHYQQTVSGSPNHSPSYNNNCVERSQAMNQPSPMTTSLPIHNKGSLPVTIPTNNNNNYNTFPGPTDSMGSMSHLVDKPNMDFAGSMRSMQEDMARLQKQMTDQFRNMHVGGPLPLTDNVGTFCDFPPIMPSPASFPRPPAYADLPVKATASNLSLLAPSTCDSEFGSMMSSDMSLGQPVIEDTLDGRGGKKSLKLNLDMHEFTPEEVKVRTDKNKIEVTAHHEEKDPNRISCRVFKQQYHLPENTRMSKLQYNMSPPGELSVEVTVKPRHRVKWAEDTVTK